MKIEKRILENCKKAYPNVERSLGILKYQIINVNGIEKTAIKFNDSCPIFCLCDGNHMMWYGDHGSYMFDCTWKASVMNIPFGSPDYLIEKLDCPHRYKEFSMAEARKCCIEYLKESSWYEEELTEGQKIEILDYLSNPWNNYWDYEELESLGIELLDRVKNVISAENEYEYIAALNCLEEIDPLYDYDCCLHSSGYAVSEHFWFILLCLNYIQVKEKERLLLENMSLKEFGETCLKHQKQARDCETCTVYTFCTKYMNSEYPSGWKFE